MIKTEASIQNPMSNFTPVEIRNGLNGPVFPIITPFDAQGAVDYSALTNYVEFLIANGARTIMTTVGTSRFNLLSEAEISSVNSACMKPCGKETIRIAAGPMTGSLASNISIAQQAEKDGADAFIAFYPERWYGPESIYRFFNELCRSVSIAVMVHEMPLRSGYGGVMQYPIDLLHRLVDIPNLVGMKEECMDGAYSYKIHRSLGERSAIIGAGAMRNFLRDFHAGAKANLAGVGSFFPKVEIAFQDALKSGKTAVAESIVRKYEDPYFDVAVALGWHPQLKQVLHFLGLMPPFEREPMPQLEPDQKTQLLGCITSLGWLNVQPDHIPEDVTN